MYGRSRLFEIQIQDELQNLVSRQLLQLLLVTFAHCLLKIKLKLIIDNYKVLIEFDIRLLVSGHLTCQ